MTPKVRPERPEDYARITAINDLAFEGTGEGVLVERLRRTGDFVPELSLVAEIDGSVVGHILFYPISIESGDREHETLSLAPMSVVPEWQRRGIGSRLVEEGLSRAKHMGYTSVIVLGHPEYYPRFGFRPASTWGIRTTYDAPDEAFLAIELVPSAFGGKSGTVRYPREFDGQ